MRAVLICLALTALFLSCADEGGQSTAGPGGDAAAGLAGAGGGGAGGGAAGQDDPCPGALTLCDGSCTDTRVDIRHCGGCDETCAGDRICDESQCRCIVGEDCGGTCIDTTIEVAHCGACDAPCPGAFEICDSGSCVEDCDFYMVEQCHGACADWMSDETHCGGCDQPCNAGYECLSGTCGCSVDVCGLCGEILIGAAVPQTVMGTTAGSSVVDAPCASTGAPELPHLFTAPSDGVYAFDTFGSSFDTALHVYDSVSCALAACNDDFFSTQSLAVAELSVGQQALVVVDGFDQNDAGNFTLSVSDTGCPAIDLGTTPQTVASATDGRFFSGSCGGAFDEVAMRFEAPAAGDYLFDTSGSAISTVLYVRDGGCTGAELACGSTTLTLSLAQGQAVVAFVDTNGASGAITLSVTQI